MTRDEVIADLAELMAGLQAPRSMLGVQALGTGMAPWGRLHRDLTGGGWHTADDYADGLRRVLS